MPESVNLRGSSGPTMGAMVRASMSSSGRVAMARRVPPDDSSRTQRPRRSLWLAMLRRTLPTVALAVFASAALVAPPARAATPYDVVSNAASPDANTADPTCKSVATGTCTLRAAVDQFDASGGDTLIALKATKYDLTPAGPLVVSAGIGTKLELRGAGAAQTTIDARNNGRVVTDTSADLDITLDGL